MNLEYMILKRKLKKERSYISIQKSLSDLRRLGIQKYAFLGDGCSVCSSLNGKTFLVKDAKVGINLPPMHLGCTCTIIGKTDIDLFKDRSGANPLQNNPKFEEWKRKQQNL